MRRLSLTLLACLAALALGAPAAQADFGLYDYDVTIEEADGSTATQAGSHPFSFTTALGVNSTDFGVDANGSKLVLAEGRIKNLILGQIPGLLADPTAYPHCSLADFLEREGEDEQPECSNSTQIGVTASSNATLKWRASRVYNLSPPPGKLLRFGWAVGGANIAIDVGVNPEPPYNGLAVLRNTPQVVEVIGSKTQLWGDPTDPAHDPLRGNCLKSRAPKEFPIDDVAGFQFESTGELCPVPPNPKPFLTLPTNCGGALTSSYAVTSWEGESEAGSVLTHDALGNPQRFTGCGALPSFNPSITAQPTTKAATSPTGLDFTLGINDEGLTSLHGRAKSQIRRAVVTLPAGMSINPSQAEGLEVCTEADLEREALAAAPGEGCPQASKIGTIEVDSPLVSETVKGALFVAEPYANLADDSLIAFYIVLKNRNLGILVKQPAKVTPDPLTGQLVTTTEEMPQLPFSEFRLHFREGARSPLASPPGCGSYDVKAQLTPWSGGTPITTTSTFEIITGPNAAPCPSAPAPFDPGFEAGTLNNAAGAYSPFLMRLTRGDGMQDLSRFSAILPPGVVGRLAGIPWCPEAGIAQARGRTGEHGGSAELADPSCPAASQIGRTVAGAGVGSQLTYVPGSLYLAGPFAGAPLSVVSITPAVAGPFDAGAVVVRVGLKLNPRTAVVEADGAASDPIPHILQGIPLNVRDLRVYTDRPDFTLNATSCEPSNTFATLWGAGTPLDPRPETPVGRAARYQAADCASLGFEPKLGIKLRGGTKRGAHPALRAHVVPRPGDANFSRAVVTLPRSAFLDQAHIRTICTRVQFAAGAGNGALCPPGAQYGFARAWSPLLDEPLQGPVFLRSSENNLPDLVVALKGPPSAAIDIELSARIDSVKGGIRSTFTGIPDAPVSRFILDMQGGKKGLIVNSRNLCVKPRRNRAKANLRGQNGKFSKTRPVVRAVKCGKKRKKAKRSSHRRARS